MGNSASPPSRLTPQPQPTYSLPESFSPDSIDTLPVLSALLSRLQTLTPNVGTGTSASPPGQAGSPSFAPSSNSPLAIKDVPSATDDLKHKLQKARVQVKELPDMQRSIGEQETEIRELEERITTQKAALDRLREAGLRAKTDGLSTEKAYGDAMET